MLPFSTYSEPESLSHMSVRDEDASSTCLSSNQERHKILWDAIFSNYEWLDEVERELQLNPVLVGAKLDTIATQKSTDLDNLLPIYMTLLSGDRSGDVVYSKDLFFGSLQPHTHVEGADEITFDSGIVLNIADIIFCPEIVPAKREKLISEKGIFYSTYSFWKDSKSEIKVLEPPLIWLTKSRNSDEWVLIAQFVPEGGYPVLERWFEDSEEICLECQESV